MNQAEYIQQRREPAIAPFEIRRQKALEENAHLPVLHTDVTLARFREMSVARELPVGAKWVLGVVYGPARALARDNV